MTATLAVAWATKSGRIGCSGTRRGRLLAAAHRLTGAAAVTADAARGVSDATENLLTLTALAVSATDSTDPDDAAALVGLTTDLIDMADRMAGLADAADTVADGDPDVMATMGPEAATMAADLRAAIPGLVAGSTLLLVAADDLGCES